MISLHRTRSIRTLRSLPISPFFLSPSIPSSDSSSHYLDFSIPLVLVER